jgi:hypothetical protein
MTREELAQKAKVHERYLRELLSFNAASGYVTYDPEIKPDGTWMIVEPMAGDRLKDNLNPVRAVILCRFNHDLCAHFDVAGRRRRSRCAGW